MRRARPIGEHIGLAFYTIGQRKGIGIGGAGRRLVRGGEAHRPRNELVVVQGHDHPLLMKSVAARGGHGWIAGAAPDEPSSAYGEDPLSAGRCAVHADAVRESEIGVDFPAPQWAVTPGQSVVLYDGEVCLGGGVITSGD